VSKFKNKWLFVLALILLPVILSIALYYLERILPAHANGFTAEIISVYALVFSFGIPLYKDLFPRKLSRAYHVSPQELTALYGAHGNICIKVHIENTGEVGVNIQFQWMDFRNERFMHTVTRDSRGQHIDSSIKVAPESQKDVYISFDNGRKNSRLAKAYIEALNKREPRLIESFRNEQSRLSWSDVTPKMQQISIPFGAWVIEILNRRINS
jgi:hypothetical protein